MNEENHFGQAHEKLIAIGKSTLILLWYYMASLIISVGIYLNIGDDDAYMEYVTAHQVTLNLVIYLMIFLGIWAFDKHRAAFIEAFKKWQLKKIIQYVLMAIGLYIVTNVLTSVLVQIFPDYNDIDNMFEQKQYVLSFISIVIMAPIVEEYMFRHKIQSYFKKVFQVEIAIVLQGFLFGMLHQYVVQKIYAMLSGIFFGYVDEKQGNVQASIIMHMTINAIGWGIGTFLLKG